MSETLSQQQLCYLAKHRQQLCYEELVAARYVQKVIYICFGAKLSNVSTIGRHSNNNILDKSSK
jgi:hypothetical protein